MRVAKEETWGMEEEWETSNVGENFWGPQMIRCLNMIIRVGVLLLFLTLDSDCKVPSGYSSSLACVAGV